MEADYAQAFGKKLSRKVEGPSSELDYIDLFKMHGTTCHAHVHMKMAYKPDHSFTSFVRLSHRSTI